MAELENACRLVLAKSIVMIHEYLNFLRVVVLLRLKLRRGEWRVQLTMRSWSSEAVPRAMKCGARLSLNRQCLACLMLFAVQWSTSLERTPCA